VERAIDRTHDPSSVYHHQPRNARLKTQRSASRTADGRVEQLQQHQLMPDHVYMRIASLRTTVCSRSYLYIYSEDSYGDIADRNANSAQYTPRKECVSYTRSILYCKIVMSPWEPVYRDNGLLTYMMIRRQTETYRDEEISVAYMLPCGDA
jgi:hypothetical protein